MEAGGGRRLCRRVLRQHAQEAPAFTEIVDIATDGRGYAAKDVGVYIQPQHQGVTHHVESSLPSDPSDAATAADMQALANDLAADLIAAGAYFSRPYGAWAQPVYNRDAASSDALRKVKAVFDPAGVMNPGKLCFGPPSAPAPRREGGPLMATLSDYRPDAMRCTRCSYCKWIPFDLVRSHRFAKGCPSVEAGRFHAYSAGGKLITALSLMDGRSEVTDQVVDVAFRCQLCGNCDVTCKLCRYDMEPILALREFRAHLVELDRVPTPTAR